MYKVYAHIRYTLEIVFIIVLDIEKYKEFYYYIIIYTYVFICLYYNKLYRRYG